MKRSLAFSAVFLWMTTVCSATNMKLSDSSCLGGSDVAAVQWTSESLFADENAAYVAFWKCHYANNTMFDKRAQLSDDEEIQASCTWGFLAHSQTLGHPATSRIDLVQAAQVICGNAVRNGKYDEEIANFKRMERTGKYPKFKPPLTY